MSAEHQRSTGGWWWALAIICAVLFVSVAFLTTRSRPTHSTLISIDSNGTTRLGPLPLRNTNLRDAAFTAVGHLNSSTVRVSVAESVKIADFSKTVLAMQRAGISPTSMIFHIEGSPTSNRVAVTNK